jgi:hypothetical protein
LAQSRNGGPFRSLAGADLLRALKKLGSSTILVELAALRNSFHKKVEEPKN